MIAVDVPYTTESREWLRAYARDTLRERFRQKAIYLKFVGPIGHLIGDKKLSAPVTLSAAIEAEQHEALRAIVFADRRSLADVVREALNTFLAQHPARRRRAAAQR